jgi:O-antigen ligase
MIYIFALIGLTCVGLFVAQLTRSVMWGWASLLIVTWYDFTFGTSASLVGSLHVDPNRAVWIALLLAGMIRSFARLRNGSTSQTLILIYTAIFLLSVIRGVAAHGVFTAGNDASGLSATLIGMFYFFTIRTDEDQIEKFVRYYVYYAVASFFTGVFAFAGFHVGSAAWAHLEGEVADERYLNSASAAALALGALLLLGWIAHRTSKRWMYWAMPLLFAMAILVRTRTVWVMLIAIAAALPFIDWKVFKRAVPMGVVCGITVLVLGATLYAGGAGLSSELESSASDEGTWAWRVNGWKAIVADPDQTPVTVLVGKSFGDGWDRWDANFGRYTTAPPHNEFLTQYLRVGLIGTLAAIFFVVRPIYLLGGMRRKRNLLIFPSASVWCLIAVGSLTFSIAYNITVDMWAFLGVANALMVDRSRQFAISDHQLPAGPFLPRLMPPQDYATNRPASGA